jgi:hypothetical protein
MAVTKAAGKRGLWLPFILVGLSVGVVWFCLASGKAPTLSVEHLLRHLGLPLVRLLLFLAVGLLAAQVLESLGWAARLGKLAAPLLRWGRLREESGASFTAACFSGVLANTMLMTFYQEGKLSRREMVTTYLLNGGLPVYLLHLPTTFFIIWPLTGKVGLIYLGLTGLAATLRSAALLGYARLRLPSPWEAGPSPVSSPPDPKPGVWADIWRKFQRRFSRLLLYALPVYVLVYLAGAAGVFRWLQEALASYAALGFVPVEAASIVMFSVAAEFTSGIAAAGALLKTGALTPHQTVMALILGNVLATPIRALRHQLPAHAGIFTLKLGTQLLLASQGLRLASLAMVALPYALWG